MQTQDHESRKKIALEIADKLSSILANSLRADILNALEPDGDASSSLHGDLITVVDGIADCRARKAVPTGIPPEADVLDFLVMQMCFDVAGVWDEKERDRLADHSGYIWDEIWTGVRQLYGDGAPDVTEEPVLVSRYAARN